MELVWYKVAFPRLVLRIWLWGDETGLTEDDTLTRATEQDMLLLCRQHWQKNPSEMEHLFKGLCKQCANSVSQSLAKFNNRVRTWFLLKPCAACKQLKVIIKLFEIQRTHVIKWSLFDSSS